MSLPRQQCSSSTTKVEADIDLVVVVVVDEKKKKKKNESNSHNSSTDSTDNNSSRSSNSNSNSSRSNCCNNSSRNRRSCRRIGGSVVTTASSLSLSKLLARWKCLSLLFVWLLLCRLSSWQQHNDNKDILWAANALPFVQSEQQQQQQSEQQQPESSSSSVSQSTAAAGAGITETEEEETSSTTAAAIKNTRKQLPKWWKLLWQRLQKQQPLKHVRIPNGWIKQVQTSFVRIVSSLPQQKQPNKQQQKQPKTVLPDDDDEPAPVIVEDFLTADEAAVLLERYQPLLRESLHFHGTAGAAQHGSYRTSRSVRLPPLGDADVYAIEQRAATLAGVPHARVEDLQLACYYGQSAWYALHRDDHNDPRVTAQAGRLATVLLYLQAPDGGGGATLFTRTALEEERDLVHQQPLRTERDAIALFQHYCQHPKRHHVVVEPAVGRAVVWYNWYSRSSNDNHNNNATASAALLQFARRSTHGACPPLAAAGTKCVLQQWITRVERMVPLREERVAAVFPAGADVSFQQRLYYNNRQGEEGAATTNEDADYPTLLAHSLVQGTCMRDVSTQQGRYIPHLCWSASSSQSSSRRGGNMRMLTDGPYDSVGALRITDATAPWVAQMHHNVTTGTTTHTTVSFWMRNVANGTTILALPTLSFALTVEYTYDTASDDEGGTATAGTAIPNAMVFRGQFFHSDDDAVSAGSSSSSEPLVEEKETNRNGEKPLVIAWEPLLFKSSSLLNSWLWCSISVQSSMTTTTTTTPEASSTHNITNTASIITLNVFGHSGTWLGEASWQQEQHHHYQGGGVKNDDSRKHAKEVVIPVAGGMDQVPSSSTSATNHPVDPHDVLTTPWYLFVSPKQSLSTLSSSSSWLSWHNHTRSSKVTSSAAASDADTPPPAREEEEEIQQTSRQLPTGDGDTQDPSNDDNDADDDDAVVVAEVSFVVFHHDHHHDQPPLGRDEVRDFRKQILRYDIHH